MLIPSDSNFAITHIAAEQLNAGNIHNLWNLMQGRVPGLMISEQRGDNIPVAPNTLFNTSSPFSVQLRGLTTFRQQNHLMIVVDGIPVIDWELVDPWDIAQISILRDGAAAALYGGQAANGVILIETKQADSTGFSIQYNSFVGVDQASRMIEVLDRDQYVSRGSNQDWGGNTDWQEAITRNAFSQAHQLALGGSVKDLSYRVSGSYRSQQRPLHESDWNRLNGRFQLHWSGLDEKLSVRVWGSAIQREDNLGFMEAFSQAAFYSPTAPIRADDALSSQYGGYFQRQIFNYQNPVAMVEQNIRRSDYTARQLGGNIKLKLSKSLSWQTQLSGFSSSVQNYQALGQESFWLGGTLNPDTLQAAQSNQRFVVESWLNANKQSRKTQFSSALGISMQRHGFSQTVDSSNRELRLSGLFARLEADFASKGLLGVHLRADHTSIFTQNQLQLYPAIYGKLFLGNLMGTPTRWTIRASYSQVGNMLSDFYLQAPRFWFEPIINTFFARNDQLRHEVTNNLNVGTDVYLLKNKVRFSLDYVSRSANRLMMLFGQPVPPNIYPVGLVNFRSLQTNGWEISTQLNLIDKKEHQFLIDLNLYGFQTRYGLIEEPFRRGEYRRFINMAPYFNVFPFPLEEEGDLLGSIVAPRLIGVESGSAWNFDDVDNDGFITADDFVRAGNAYPDFSMGIGFHYRWKRMTISGLLRGRFGHQKVNPLYIALYNNANASTDRNQSLDLATSPQNWPEFVSYSSLFVENASFLQLHNLKLAFSISEKRPAFQLYFVTQNLFTLTAYPGIDPDVSTQSAGIMLLPGFESANAGYLPRSWVMGLSCKL